MGGDDQDITIPAVMISLDQANRLKSLLSQDSYEASIVSRQENPLLDSSLDNLIITHEYGHGISTRLVAGANIIDCLDNVEQMGEGWSDYFGLMLTTDWTVARGEDSRGIGTYVSSESPLGTGLRRYPYSTNQLLNPMHYDQVKESSLTHDIGAIWCAMLWDMTWEIIGLEGISADLFYGSGGNNIALQLVMTGLKLTRCSPGFVDGRDAILKADSLIYGGKYQYPIWKAFAGRGLGFSADQGNSLFNFDGKSSSDMPEAFQTQIEQFDAVEVTDHINLQILSRQEFDNEAFIIQRSLNKVNYSTIAIFDGEVYHPDPRSFSHRDDDVSPGQVYYYRLLMRNTRLEERIVAMDSAVLIPVSDILVFPNPTSGQTALKINRTLTGEVQVNIFSAQGQLLRKEALDAAELYIFHPLPFNNLATGVYVLEVIANGQIYRQKVLKT